MTSLTRPVLGNLAARAAALAGLTAATILIGWTGTFYEQLGPSAFWALHAAIGGVGGVLALLFSRTFGRLLEPQPSQSFTR